MKSRYFLILTFLFSSLSQAQDFFYRMDHRPPSEIFAEGFIAPGKNDDILKHIEGISCFNGDRSTIFISTTTSEDFAINGLITTDFYVYDIRPTQNFFSLYNSLLFASRATHLRIYRDRAETFREQDEYVAKRVIDTSQIYRVRHYRRETENRDSPAILVETLLNPNYVVDATTANPEPYHIFYDPDSGASSDDSCYACISNSSSSAYLSAESTPFPNTDKMQKCKKALQTVLMESARQDEKTHDEHAQ